MTSDKVEALATGLIPGSRASFFDFDAADDLGPAHAVREPFFRQGERERGRERESKRYK